MADKASPRLAAQPKNGSGTLLACGYGLFLVFYYACAQWGTSSLAGVLPGFAFFQSVMRWTIVIGYLIGLVWGLSHASTASHLPLTGPVLASGVGLCSLAVINCLSSSLPALPIAACLTAVLLGVSSALLNICWITTFKALPAATAQTSLAGSAICAGGISVVPSVLITQNYPLQAIAAIAVCAAISAVILARSSNVQGKESCAPKPQPAVAVPLRHSALLKTLAPVFACSLIVPVLQPMAGMMLIESGAQPTPHGLIWCAGEIIAGILLLAIWHLHGPQVTATQLFLGSMPVLITVAALFPFLGNSYWPILYLFSEIFRALMLVSAIAACLAAAQAHAINPIAPYCTLALLMFASDLGGGALGMLVTSITPGSTDKTRLVGLLFMFTLACIALAFYFAQRIRPKEAPQALEPASCPAPQPQMPLCSPPSDASTEGRDIYQRIADTYGLSARETEVLALQAKGRNVPFISEELGVSQATVRSHVKRIHQALNIHTQQELIDIAEHFTN